MGVGEVTERVSPQTISLFGDVVPGFSEVDLKRRGLPIEGDCKKVPLELRGVLYLDSFIRVCVFRIPFWNVF